MNKVNEFIEIIKTKVGCGYVWGTQGEDLTPSYLKYLCDTFGLSHYYLGDGTKADKWLGKQVFDCSGLIVYALRELGLIERNEDYNTDGLLNMCDKVTWIELQTGDLLFKGTVSSTFHVGVYIDGYVIEANSTALGVILTTNLNSWDIVGRLKIINEESVKMLQLGSKGFEVTDLQVKLKKLGYALPVFGADGDFGEETLKAVLQFQKDNQLKEDGIVGDNTLNALNYKLEQLDTPIDYKEKYETLLKEIEELYKRYGGQ